MTLHITCAALDAIVRRAHAEHPIESCGMVTANIGLALAQRVIPMTNQAASETFFRFDSRDQLRVYRDLNARDEECRAVYHSHTASEAYPSKDDVDYAGQPEVHYLIVSTWAQTKVPVRSFRIIDGHVTEESIVVVDAA
ncbi:peptidase [Ventosimonas gracilis]|uniref:Peptidase n=1 Tax=Ventosimonas gracilis TaxID=1680762 RepID=A0A139SVM1_9GAMM|nr:M67 family metallopeptidase [Ventosimonas gracilis]KXU38481.1 peptidase [Ventosimonas gracilis]